MPQWAVARRQRIVDVAAGLFAARPFEAVQMDEIAQAAELGKPTLYRYFPSKEALFLAATETLLRRLTAEVAAIAARPGSALEALADIIGAITDTLAPQISVLILFTDIDANSAEEWRAQFRGCRDALIAAIAAVLERGAADGSMARREPGPTAALILGMIRGGLMVPTILPHGDLKRTTIDLLTHGLERR